MGMCIYLSLVVTKFSSIATNSFNPTLRWGHYTCDGRRSISEIQAEFPDCDFSEVHYALEYSHNTDFSQNIPSENFYLSLMRTPTQI